MPKWLGIVVQLILLAGQCLNQITTMLPEESKWIVLAVLGALQVAATAVQAHFNPDGSPATLPYRG